MKKLPHSQSPLNEESLEFASGISLSGAETITPQYEAKDVGDMQSLKKLAEFLVAAIAMLSLGAAASEPPSWINFVGIGVFGLIIYLVNRYDNRGNDAEEEEEAPEVVPTPPRVDGRTHWVQCMIHDDDELPEGVYRLPEPI